MEWLRNIGRNLDKIIYPDKEKSYKQYLSVTCSIPEWMITLWEKNYSLERIEKIAEAFLKEEPLTIRCNITKITPEALVERLKNRGMEVNIDEKLPYALHVRGVDYLGSIPEFAEGLFYVQDLSSMKVAEAAEVKANDTVIDVCGAPGGKSIHIAQLLSGSGRVITRDVSEYKVSLIEENIRRHQVTNMTAEQWDARVSDKGSIGKADVVIADLPCSGLGVLRKKPDIKYRMQPEDIKSLIALQREILSTVHQYVKPGGRMIYSTCTIDAGENEENVAWFMANHKEFEVESMEQILPDELGSDGFFIARLRKQNV